MNGVNSPKAPEFMVIVEARLEGGWLWRISCDSFSRFFSGSQLTGGYAMTAWGARHQGRKALKKIRRYQRLNPEAT